MATATGAAGVGVQQDVAVDGNPSRGGRSVFQD